jgi:hypothetical protein
VTPSSIQVQYSSLVTGGSLGWQLNAARAPGSPSPDFWSVICNNFDQVNATSTGCKLNPNSGPQAGVGEVHVRYDCNSKTFWVLAYVYSGYDLEPDSDSMFALDRCTGNNPPSPTAPCGNSNTKFLQVCVPCERCNMLKMRERMGIIRALTR